MSEVVARDSILTFSGIYVTPLDLQPEHVRIEDIAHALSHQCRYSGHTSEFYSVAQHSVLVADYLWMTDHPTSVILAGLMHDASEAYLVDLPRPLKDHEEFGALYRHYEEKAQRVISEVLDVEYPLPEAVHEADTVLLAAERKRFMPPNGDWGLGDLDEFPVVTAWPPAMAREQFLTTYYQFAQYANHRRSHGTQQ